MTGENDFKVLGITKKDLDVSDWNNKISIKLINKAPVYPYILFCRNYNKEKWSEEKAIEDFFEDIKEYFVSLNFKNKTKIIEPKPYSDNKLNEEYFGMKIKLKFLEKEISNFTSKKREIIRKIETKKLQFIRKGWKNTIRNNLNTGEEK